jgi:hypothetical protein
MKKTLALLLFIKEIGEKLVFLPSEKGKTVFFKNGIQKFITGVQN